LKKGVDFCARLRYILSRCISSGCPERKTGGVPMISSEVILDIESSVQSTTLSENMAFFSQYDFIVTTLFSLTALREMVSHCEEDSLFIVWDKPKWEGLSSQIEADESICRRALKEYFLTGETPPREGFLLMRERVSLFLGGIFNASPVHISMIFAVNKFYTSFIYLLKSFNLALARRYKKTSFAESAEIILGEVSQEVLSMSHLQKRIHSFKGTVEDLTEVERNTLFALWWRAKRFYSEYLRD